LPPFPTFLFSLSFLIWSHRSLVSFHT
jgi:hypothetical protein